MFRINTQQSGRNEKSLHRALGRVFCLRHKDYGHSLYRRITILYKSGIKFELSQGRVVDRTAPTEGQDKMSVLRKRFVLQFLSYELKFSLIIVPSIFSGPLQKSNVPHHMDLLSRVASVVRRRCLSSIVGGCSLLG